MTCVTKVSSLKKREFSFAFANKSAPDSFFHRGLYITLYVTKEKKYKEHNAKKNIIRIGLVISKKSGKAVKRNKIRRRLRALIKFSFRGKKNNMGKYYTIVFAHKNIMQACYKVLQKELDFLLRKHAEKLSKSY